jgi:hypothetical protein
MAKEKTFETLKEIVEQLKMPNYQTKDGLHDLEDNAAFKQLEYMAEINHVPTDIIGDLKSMSNNYIVLNGQYVISKNVLDLFIEHLSYRT